MAVELTYVVPDRYGYTLDGFYSSAGTNFTYMGWVYPTAIPTIASHNSTYSMIGGMQANIAAGGLFDGSNYRWEIGTAASDFTGSIITLNQWYHIALVRNGNAMILYVNGEVDVSQSEVASNNNTRMNIGEYEWVNSDGDLWKGMLAYFKIYEAVLTQAEVQQEMRQGQPVRTTNLRGFFPFYSANDDTTDYSGNGLNLTELDRPGTSVSIGPPVPFSRGRQRVLIPATSVVLQYASPESDINAGSWTTATLFSKIDETVADTSDFISSPIAPQDATCELGLGALNTPTARTSHVLRYKYRRSGADNSTINLTVGLYEGATLIATTTHNNVQTSWVDGVLTLSEAEATNISNYSNLRIKFTADTA